jgi:hypothetical protein
MPNRHPSRIPLDVRGLTGNEALFRLSGASPHDAAVEGWFDAEPALLRTIARHWFAQMRRCGDDVRELIHDGCPVACVEDAPFAYVNTFKTHVNVGFFRGAMLEDRSGLLEGSGKRMRHVKLKHGATVDTHALGQLIQIAYDDIRTQLGCDRP